MKAREGSILNSSIKPRSSYMCYALQKLVLEWAWVAHLKIEGGQAGDVQEVGVSCHGRTFLPLSLL